MNDGILPCFQRPTLLQMYNRPLCIGRGIYGERLCVKTELDGLRKWATLASRLPDKKDKKSS